MTVETIGEDKGEKSTGRTIELDFPAAKKPKVAKMHGMTLEQHRRKYGDILKGKISMEKYAIAARTFFEAEMPLDVFKALIVPHARSITPSMFDNTTPVVVALFDDKELIGNAFGHSKIKGGNKFSQFCANICDIIYFPQKQLLRVHWTMK
jgi:hypothetical protein